MGICARALRLIATVGISCLTAACVLPRGAGVEAEVLRSADDAPADFAIYPVTRALLPTIAEWPLVGEDHLRWISSSAGSPGRVIRPGDSLSLVLWDSSENSLLTPEGSPSTNLENLRVTAAGSVFLPYVGNVRVSGLSPDRARARIQENFESIAPSAQVQLSMTEGRGNAVDLVGGVNVPGSYPMPDRNFTVLGLIAAGGGVAGNLDNPQIRLKRGGTLYGTSINRLFSEPQLDTLLHGGDQVIIEEDDRYFLSIGAAGTEALHPFTKDIVSALDALSIIGGVNDSRGDAQGILILREYPQAAVRTGRRGPDKQQVVFSLDLTSADGLFAARNLRIAPGDLVYVSESPVVATRTVFGLIGSVFGLVNTVDAS